MRLGTYTDTLELENEMLRKQVKELKAELQPYLDAEAKRMQMLIQSNKLDELISLWNKQYSK